MLQYKKELEEAKAECDSLIGKFKEIKIGNQDSSLYFELIAYDTKPPGLKWRKAIECNDNEGISVLMSEIDWENGSTMARIDYTMRDVSIPAY